MPTVSYSVVDMFEKEVAKYTGAKYAIAVEIRRHLV
jgi:dTDP-4-amino-4,6-dideoxygalactose transaminase